MIKDVEIQKTETAIQIFYMDRLIGRMDKDENGYHATLFSYSGKPTSQSCHNLAVDAWTVLARQLFNYMD
jgi:hypothetical protein